VGWLDKWDIPMAIRELVQNTTDYISKKNNQVEFKHKANVSESVVDVLPDQVLKMVKSAFRDNTLKCFETTLVDKDGKLPTASVLTGLVSNGDSSLLCKQKQPYLQNIFGR
jgi:hypothetical protein